MSRINSVIAVCACALCSLWVLVNFSFYFIGPTAHMSDLTLHLSVLLELDRTVKTAGNPLDFWYDASPFGYPLFRTYQHVPHLIIYAVYSLCGEAFSLEALLRWSTVALASMLPCSVLLSMRVLGFSWAAAAIAGAASVGIAEAGDYGLGVQNYTWGTGGIITQLWGVLFFFPAFAYCMRYLFHARSLGWALLFSFLSCGSHLVCAVGLAVSLIIVTLSCPALLRSGSRMRVLLLGLGLAAVTAYQWVLIILDRPYIHQSIHEPRWKFSGHGLWWVVNNFWRGDLFDVGRFPSITILVLIGLCALIFGLSGPSSETHRLRYAVLFSFLSWILLLCGWELWGSLMKDTPIINTFHVHRFIVLVHIFGIFALSYGVQALLRWPALRVPVLFALLALFVPVFRERTVRMGEARILLEEALQAQRQDSDLNLLIAELKTLPRGYIHVGMEGSWANEMKIGRNLPLRDVLLGQGLPTFAMLYHAYGLSGDVLFDFNPYDESHYQLFNVRYTVAPINWRPANFLRQLKQFGRFQLYEYPPSSILGLYTISFQVPPTSSAAATANAMRTWLKSAAMSSRQLGLLRPNKEIPNNSSQVDTQASELLSVSYSAPGRIEANGSCSANQVLLFKNGYHPNWSAAINGKKAETLWVTPGFLAVPCGDGPFTLVLFYDASDYKTVLFAVSLIILVITLAGYGSRSEQT